MSQIYQAPPPRPAQKMINFFQACYSHVVGVVVRCNRMKVAKTVEAPFNEAVVNNDLCRMVGTLEPEEVNENRQDNGMFKDNLLVIKGQSIAFKHMGCKYLTNMLIFTLKRCCLSDHLGTKCPCK